MNEHSICDIRWIQIFRTERAIAKRDTLLVWDSSWYRLVRSGIEAYFGNWDVDGMICAGGSWRDGGN